MGNKFNQYDTWAVLENLMDAHGLAVQVAKSINDESLEKMMQRRKEDIASALIKDGDLFYERKG